MRFLDSAGCSFTQRFFAVGLFIANINCVFIANEDRPSLPPSLARRVCENAAISSIEPAADYRTPTRRLNTNQYPLFEDDLDLDGMQLALQRQLDRFSRRDMRGSITFGEDRYSLVAVKDSLFRFRQFVIRARNCMNMGGENSKLECLQDFRDSINHGFAVYVPNLAPEDPRYGQPESALFTGYYTAHLEVSLTPTGEYNVPIYTNPRDEWVSRLGRYQIDFREGIAGRGLELYYAKDRFAVYLLQLEGGGRLSFRDHDGRARSVYVSYDGSNGRQWRFLSSLMLDRNWITNPAIPYQRQFISENPQLAAEIFSYCPSYVYFRETLHPPEGSDQVPLTDNRSIATDRNNYGFKGVLTFVRTKRPRPINLGDGGNKEIEMMPFSRFVLDQDTGGAIRGKARADFYFGEGEYAELAANTLKQRGDIFFLMLKSEVEK